MNFGSIDPLVACVPYRTDPAQPCDQLVSSIPIHVEPLHVFGARCARHPHLVAAIECTFSNPTFAVDEQHRSSLQCCTSPEQRRMDRIHQHSSRGPSGPVALEQFDLSVFAPHINVVSRAKPHMPNVTHRRVDVYACVGSVRPSWRSFPFLEVVFNQPDASVADKYRCFRLPS